MPPMLPGGIAGGAAFPNAASTGPAAGGYTSLTPVTGAVFEIEAGHGASWPSWVSQPDGEWGPVTVTGCAFGEGTSIYCTIPDISFIGCSILAAPGATAGISYPSPATTVAAGSDGGEISAIASWASPSPGVLDIVSSTAFNPAGGTVTVAASGPATATITYTGVSGNTLTGCYVSGSATGTVATGGAVTVTGGQLLVQYCTISAQDGTAANRLHICVDGDNQYGTITIDHCNFYWWEQGVHTAETTVITSSYIHDPVYQSGDHSEPVTINAGTVVTAENCTLLNSLDQTAVMAGATSPASYTITGCFLGGGDYPFYSYSAASDIVITGNWLTTAYFEDCGYFGIFYTGTGIPDWGGASGNVWADNYWYDGPSGGSPIGPPS